MSLPKQLIQSFEDIKSSGLVSGILTESNVQIFTDILNRSIPTAMNPVSYALYKFNRSKYIANKERFVQDIKDFAPYDSMILWTDFKDILSFFNLEGKIFLGWNKNQNRYRSFLLKAEPKQIKILRKEDKLSSIHELNEKWVSTDDPNSPISIQENIDNDMDKLYVHMQERLFAVTKQINSIEE